MTDNANNALPPAYLVYWDGESFERDEARPRGRNLGMFQSGPDEPLEYVAPYEIACDLSGEARGLAIKEWAKEFQRVWDSIR